VALPLGISRIAPVFAQTNSAVVSITSRMTKLEPPADSLDAGDLVEQQAQVGLHVAYHDLELVVGVLTGDRQAFQYLWPRADLLLEVRASGVAVG